jgi:hypothetical protein
MAPNDPEKQPILLNKVRRDGDCKYVIMSVVVTLVMVVVAVIFTITVDLPTREKQYDLWLASRGPWVYNCTVSGVSRTSEMKTVTFLVPNDHCVDPARAQLVSADSSWSSHTACWADSNELCETAVSIVRNLDDSGNYGLCIAKVILVDLIASCAVLVTLMITITIASR